MSFACPRELVSFLPTTCDAFFSISVGRYNNIISSPFDFLVDISYRHCRHLAQVLLVNCMFLLVSLSCDAKNIVLSYQSFSIEIGDVLMASLTGT